MLPRSDIAASAEYGINGLRYDQMLEQSHAYPPQSARSGTVYAPKKMRQEHLTRIILLAVTYIRVAYAVQDCKIKVDELGETLQMLGGSCALRDRQYDSEARVNRQ